MKCLAKNKTEFWYALYKQTTYVTDSEGHKTGERRVEYYAPVQAKGYVKAETGTATLEEYGVVQNYERTIYTNDKSCPITEDTILWVGINPTVSQGQPTVPHNYVVKKVSKSLNTIAIQIKEIKITKGA